MSKQFIVKKFKQYVTNIGIIVKNVLVEAHHFIRLIKRYHDPLCQIYSIITTKLLRIKSEVTLQMFFKTLNDSARLNGLVPTLLVFSAYFCMINIDTPSSIINQYNIAMRKAIEEVRRSYTSY